MLKSEVELTSIPITIEKALKLETTIKGSGWSVEANRSPTVCYCIYCHVAVYVLQVFLLFFLLSSRYLYLKFSSII